MVSELVLEPILLVVNINYEVLSDKLSEGESLVLNFLNTGCSQIIDDGEVANLSIALISLFPLPYLLQQHVDLVRSA